MTTTTKQHSIRAYRQALRTRFGARRYKIRPDGQIDAFDQQLYAGRGSWIFFGRIGSADTENRLGLAMSGRPTRKA